LNTEELSGAVSRMNTGSRRALRKFAENRPNDLAAATAAALLSGVAAEDAAAVIAGMPADRRRLLLAQARSQERFHATRSYAQANLYTALAAVVEAA
jgi:hypothetical protein